MYSPTCTVNDSYANTTTFNATILTLRNASGSPTNHSHEMKVYVTLRHVPSSIYQKDKQVTLFIVYAEKLI